MCVSPVGVSAILVQYDNTDEGDTCVECIRLNMEGFRLMYVINWKNGIRPTICLGTRYPSKSRLRGLLDLECHALSTVKYYITSALTLEVQRESKVHPALSKIIQGLQSANINKYLMQQDPNMNNYVKVIDELSLARDIVLRGNIIVIPPSLIKKANCIAHKSHHVVVKIKQFLRSIVCFLNMDAIIERHFGKCISCQASVNTPKQQPVKSTYLQD